MSWSCLADMSTSTYYNEIPVHLVQYYLKNFKRLGEGRNCRDGRIRFGPQILTFGQWPFWEPSPCWSAGTKRPIEAQVPRRKPRRVRYELPRKHRNALQNPALVSPLCKISLYPRAGYLASVTCYNETETPMVQSN